MPDSGNEKAETIIPPKSASYPQELASEYHKAHKQLMLWAAILFVWEFVGIDLDKANDAEGYAGALVKLIKITQAVPWVLLILVTYFLFKCSTEWAQCHIDRRGMRFAKVDFVSAWIVAVGAVALYIWQAVSRNQLADVLLNSNRAKCFFLGLVSGGAIAEVAATILVRRKNLSVNLPPDWKFMTGIMPIISMAITIFAILRWRSVAFALWGNLIGLVLTSLFLWAAWLISHYIRRR